MHKSSIRAGIALLLTLAMLLPVSISTFAEETQTPASSVLQPRETGDAYDVEMTEPEEGTAKDADPAEPVQEEVQIQPESSTRGLNTSNKEPAELNGYNFVLFGLSGENSGDDNRSDTIMIVTVDQDRKEIKLTSILRDTKAAIEGHEPQKINAAYKYGGADLALKTINQNFSLDLKEYVTVDFTTLEDVIDILGGIEIELTEDEVYFINSYASEPVTEGLNTLNGEQALLYSRIRKIDSDKIRAGRQQKVIREILAKLKGSNFLQWLQVLFKVLETSEISMSVLDIIKVISLPLSSYQIVNNVIPDIDYDTDLTTMIDEHGEWIWVYDLEAAGNRIVAIINNQ
ncbi:MAG: LCP family protein [Parasporobacterium sp.]|nr:LCP family protein [Parasporobacterium sp.]